MGLCLVSINYEFLFLSIFISTIYKTFFSRADSLSITYTVTLKAITPGFPSSMTSNAEERGGGECGTPVVVVIVVMTVVVVGDGGGAGGGGVGWLGGGEDGDIRVERFIERTMRRFV